MKKTVIGVMLLLGIGATQVSAQTTSFGAKAEANISNFILSDMDGAKSKMNVGATVGGFAKFDITRGFAIQPELLFSYQSSKMEVGNEEDTFNYWGMEIPVYAMGQWYCNNGSRFYAAVGPYIGVGFSAKYKDADVNLYKDDALQPWDFGAKAQIGYEFANRIQINAGYKIGFINAVDKGDGKMLPQTVSLGIGYRF